MSQAPTPVPAATILMLRDGTDALEVFMVVRHHQIDFASGALVFPGGKVDAGDSQVRSRCVGVDAADDISLALQVGAIREAFEECGILLAREPGSTDLISAKRLLQLEPYREALVKNELSIAEFLDRGRGRQSEDATPRVARKAACQPCAHALNWLHSCDIHC